MDREENKDPIEYISLIGYLIIFAAFFDAKMEYMQHKKFCGLSIKFLKNMVIIQWERKFFLSWQIENGSFRSISGCGRL